MADDPNEDTWLYGSSNPEPPGDDDVDTQKPTESAEAVGSTDDGGDALIDNNAPVC